KNPARSRRGPPFVSAGRKLGRQDGDDLHRVRIDDQQLIADQDVIKAAVFGHDPHHLGRQHRDVNVSRYSRADAHREARAIDPRHVAIADDDVLDLDALVLGELDGCSTRPAGRDAAALLRLALERLAAILVLAHALLRSLLRPVLVLSAALLTLHLRATLLFLAALLLSTALLALHLRSTLLFLAALFLSTALIRRAALLLCAGFVALLLGESLALLTLQARLGFVLLREVLALLALFILLREALALLAFRCRFRRRRLVLRAAAGRATHLMLLLGAWRLRRAALCSGVLRHGKSRTPDPGRNRPRSP